MSSGGGGLLAAWDDRLAVIKTGAITSFMAGSLGGERAATFHFTDTTGIEYNSGLLNGVLGVLTPSYDGEARRGRRAGGVPVRAAVLAQPPVHAERRDPTHLETTLSGDLEGVVRWYLADLGPETRMDFEQDVQVTGRLASRAARPVMVWNPTG